MKVQRVLKVTLITGKQVTVKDYGDGVFITGGGGFVGTPEYELSVVEAGMAVEVARQMWLKEKQSELQARRRSTGITVDFIKETYDIEKSATRDPSKKPMQKVVADRLGLSVRGLQKILKKAGVEWAEIKK